VVLFWCLHWQQRDALIGPKDARYPLGWLALAAVATWEAVWLLDHRHYRLSWALGALGNHCSGAALPSARTRPRGSAAAQHLGVAVGARLLAAVGFGYLDERFVEEFRAAGGLAFVAGVVRVVRNRGRVARLERVAPHTGAAAAGDRGCDRARGLGSAAERELWLGRVGAQHSLHSMGLCAASSATASRFAAVIQHPLALWAGNRTRGVGAGVAA
jgi:hypothetical protein